MLILQTTFDDLVQVPPHGIRNNQISRNDLEDRINEKYSNKVQPTTAIVMLILTVGQIVQNVGLCIAMYDLLKASDGLIGNGTGNVNVNGTNDLLFTALSRSSISQSNFG